MPRMRMEVQHLEAQVQSGKKDLLDMRRVQLFTH